MRRPPPPAPRRLLGETYLFRAGDRRVTVLDYELVPGTGRTGRLIVAPADEAAGRPFAVKPEDLE